MLEPPLSNSFASSESGVSTDVGQKPKHVGSLARRRRTLSNSVFIILCFLVILGSFSLFGIMIYLFRGGGVPTDNGKL